jgi:hypothetical protein
VYVDDLLAIGMEPRATLNILESDYNYVLKYCVPPTRYLGASIGTYDLDDQTKCFFMSPDQYLANAITVVQANLQKHNIKLNYMRSDVPITPGYHPEVDRSDPLNADAMNLYQSYVGVLRWCIELGRIDVCNALGKLVSYLACPRIGYVEAVLQVLSYLSKHGRYKLVFDQIARDWSNCDWTHPDWKDFYPGEVEQLPHDMPIPLGKSIQMNMFCDTSQASDLVTRRSTTGFLIYLCGTPVVWYSKSHNTVESSTFSYEFIALRIATEKVEALRTKLRQFGVPLDGPCNTFVDNKSVVTQSTKPESTLTKKHNSIAYHKVRESIAMGVQRICFEKGCDNQADCLAKSLPAYKLKQCMNKCLY